MPKRRAKGGSRVSGKSRVEKRRRGGTEQLSSAVRKAHRSEDLTEIKNFIQKALDFGVKSGYLIAKDDTQRVLRVSSELIHDEECHDAVANDEKAVSQERERSPRRVASKPTEHREEDRNKRHKKRMRSRRRSRSGSKKRRRKSRNHRKRSRSQVPEQPTDNCDDYEIENSEEGRTADDPDGNLEDPQINKSDGEKNVRKGDDEDSESSTAEEESDDDEDKKEDDSTKS